MKNIRLSDGSSMLVMESGEGVELLNPMFEIACNPTISIREMLEYRAKRLGYMVVSDEVEL